TAGGTWTDGRDASKPISVLNEPTTTFHAVENRVGPAIETQHYGAQLRTYSQITKGQYGHPAVVSDGTTLYMAHLRGNSDIYAGSVWWAYSTDNGVTWQESATPLMYGKYHSQFGPRGKEHVFSGGSETSGAWEPEGFHSVTMAFRTEGTSTWAYIYASYYHPGREANVNSWATSSNLTYRIRIDKTMSGHLSNDRQLLYDDPAQGFVWKRHNGAFTWSDPVAGDPTTCWVCNAPYLPDTNYADATKVAPGRVRSSWQHYTSQDGLWDTASVTHNGTDFVMLLWNGNANLAGNEQMKVKVSKNGVDWSGPYSVDASYLLTDPKATPPGASVGLLPVHPTLWYGTLSGTTAYWGFFPLHWFGTYNGTRILPAKLGVPSGQTFPVAPAGNTYAVIN
ncbi:MAG TPA: hypothetical protein VF911_03985, partial [Thermoanaerobaculia bacterium]